MLADSALKRGKEVSFESLAGLQGWYPIAIEEMPSHGHPMVWWRYLGVRRLTAAFFEDSFVGLPTEHKLVCRSPISALDHLPEPVSPSAFVFHVSRCGSTLLTQMLSTLPHCIVVSEPPVLDSFFRLHQKSPGLSGGARMLRKLIAALGQRRDPCESHFFIKLDSWHMPWLPWLQSVFPSTPFLLMYREPTQVLASHYRQRGAHMVPGLVDLSNLQINTVDLAVGDLDGFAVRVLEGIFRSAVIAAKGSAQGGRAGLKLLSYRELPYVLWTHLLAEWSVPCSAEQLEALQLRAGFNAKHSTALFAGTSPDTLDGPEAHAALHSDYEILELLRKSQLNFAQTT